MINDIELFKLIINIIDYWISLKRIEIEDITTNYINCLTIEHNYQIEE